MTNYFCLLRPHNEGFCRPHERQALPALSSNEMLETLESRRPSAAAGVAGSSEWSTAPNSPFLLLKMYAVKLLPLPASQFHTLMSRSVHSLVANGSRDGMTFHSHLRKQ